MSKYPTIEELQKLSLEELEDILDSTLERHAQLVATVTKLRARLAVREFQKKGGE